LDKNSTASKEKKDEFWVSCNFDRLLLSRRSTVLALSR